jgi:hypothetical protein
LLRGPVLEGDKKRHFYLCEGTIVTNPEKSIKFLEMQNQLTILRKKKDEKLVQED